MTFSSCTSARSWGARLCAGLIVLLCAIEASSMVSAEELKATPYRPTVSNPAALPVPQYLEIEAGWQSVKAKSDDSFRHSLPYLLKFAFTDRVGVLLGSQTVIVQDRPDAPTQAGSGDFAGFLKLRQPVPSAMPSALGLEFGVKFPTAPTTVGTGRTDYLGNLIYSAGFGDIGLDLNLLYTRLGGAPSGQGKDQLGWVTTVSYSVTDRMSVAGEFFGSYRDGVRPFLQYLSAVSYAIIPRVVADGGVAFGLTADSQEWTLFAGVTILAWSPF